MLTTETDVTRTSLRALVDTLRRERRTAADAGDILTCDMRSADIDDVEHVMALLAGERDG